MSDKAARRLLERMKDNSAGWHPQDFHTLYLGFGFTIRNGAKHDIFIHPDFPQIRDSIPRHAKELSNGYAKDAVKNIEALIELQKE